jgi:predicted transposase/invertase (TIGR01784 family)
MANGFLSPKSDLVFKLLFGDSKSIDILTDFLKSVLRLPVDEYDEVAIVDPHLLREYVGDKLGILDVKVKTKTMKTIDVEIQVLPYPELKSRIVYYSAKMITEQVGAGEDYSQIKQVISIIITDYTLIPENDRYHNCYTLYDPKTQSELTDIIEINTLELSKLPESEDGTNLWNWMKFLSAQKKEDLDMAANTNPQIQKAVVRLEELSNDERTRLLLESRQKLEFDIRMHKRHVENEARKKGQEEGLAEGRIEGRLEGRLEGQREGRLEGRLEGQREGIYITAKNLFRMNMPLDKIAEATGLTLEEVKNLVDGK